MSSLLGGHSKQKSASVANSTSNSSNQAYPFLQSALGGSVGTGANAQDMVAQLLGVAPATDATNDAFNRYKDSTGYNFQMQQGQNAINSDAAAKGLLSSGSTLKALNQYGQNLGNTTFNNYLQNLLGLGTQGNQAASILGGAGNVSNATSNTNATSSGKSKQGLGL